MVIRISMARKGNMPCQAAIPKAMPMATMLNPTNSDCQRRSNSARSDR